MHLSKRNGNLGAVVHLVVQMVVESVHKDIHIDSYHLFLFYFDLIFLQVIEKNNKYIYFCVADLCSHAVFGRGG